MAVTRRKDFHSSIDSNHSSIAESVAAASSDTMLTAGRKLQEEEEEGLIDAAAAAAHRQQHQPAFSSCRMALLLPLAVLILVILFLLLRPSSCPVPSPQSSPLSCCVSVSYHPRLRLVGVGDSITEFASRPGSWLSLLAEQYTRKADVYNRGYAGYNTRHYLHLLRHHLQRQLFPFTPAASPSLSPSTSSSPSPAYQHLVTLFLGTNDAALPDSGTAEANISVPLSEFTANLRQLIAMLLPDYAPLLLQPQSRDTAGRYLSSVTALVLITPPQLNITQWQLRHLTPPYPPLSSLPVTRSLTACQQYVAAVREIAASWSIPVVDLWSLTAPSPSYDMLSDGLHLNTRGNQLLYSALLSVIGSHFPMLMPEMLELDGPLYREIDAANVAASFAVK